MSHYGDLTKTATVHIFFTTVDAAGAPVTLTGTPSVEISPNGSTTPIVTGITLEVDHDGIVGRHHIAIDLTDAAFTEGGEYDVYLAAGVADGTSLVGYSVGSFSIRNRPIISGVQRNRAFAEFPFVMIDSTTRLPVAGRTVTVSRRLAGGSFGVGSLSPNPAADVGNGVYTTDFAAADLNSASIILLATAPNCLPTIERIITVPAT